MANTDEAKVVTNVDNGVKSDENGATDKKSEEVVESEPILLTKDLEQKIIRQIEYYFGDINLPRDKFLNEQITLDEGWVPINVLLKFKRLQSICNDEETIAKALLNAKLVVVSEDHKKVRRNPELAVPEYNEERRKELMARTAYIKGFPVNEKLESIEKFMAPYGPCESISMRTYLDKALKKQIFKGSIFVIFKDIDICKKFLEGEEITYENKPLIRKWQADYLEEKKKEWAERNEKRDKNKNKDANKTQETKKPQFAKGSIIHMSGFKENTLRETIKQVVTEVGDKEVAYVTYGKGDSEGYVRFSEENAGIEFVKSLTDSKFTVDDAEITVRALEGEEEKIFLDDLYNTLSKMRHQHHGSRGKKRKGGKDGGSRSKHSRKH